MKYGLTNEISSFHASHLGKPSVGELWPDHVHEYDSILLSRSSFIPNQDLTRELCSHGHVSRYLCSNQYI
jgi:hypothetical protein